MAITRLGIWKPTPRPPARATARGQRSAVWHGAQLGRLYGDWVTGQIDPITELRGGLEALRTRARDLERNSPLVRRYLALVQENVIGSQGIRLQATNTLEHGPNILVNRQIEAAWQDWGRVGVCTRDGRDSLTRWCRRVVRDRKRDGEVFVWLLRGAGPWGLQVVLVPPELVDATYDAGPFPDGRVIRQGVEQDRFGRPLAYHVWTQARLEWSTMAGAARERIPASDMVHWFEQRRTGQVRGESRLAPVLAWLRQHDAFVEAALVAARAGAAKMGFRQPSADGPVYEDQDLADTAAEPDQPTEVAPGVIETLEVGETFESYDPTYPHEAFAPFMSAAAHFLAAGMNVAHASLTGDLSEVNYGSLRGGELKERDGWRLDQQEFVEHVLEPIYTAWWALAQLKIRGLRADASAYTAHRWQPRGWPWIDPEKELKAAKLALEMRLTSRTRLCAEQGADFEDVLAEHQAEQELAEAYGVDLTMEGADGDQGGPAGDAADDAADDDAARPPRRGDAGRGRRADRMLALLRSAR